MLRRTHVSALSVLALAASASLSSPAKAECRSDIDAVSLANEADGLRTTDVDAAIAKYQQAIALSPTQHRVVYKLALAYVRKEMWAEVVRTTERATKLAPTFANYAATRGFALARMAEKGDGSWTDARSALQAALALDDGDAEAHLELGDALLHLDDEKGALVQFDRAVHVAPDRSAGYFALADLYLRLGFASHAEKTLTEGLRLTRDEGRFSLFMLAGRVAERKHDTTTALSRYEEARRTCGACSDGAQSLVYFALGTAYASVTPPRKSEAIVSFAAFSKLVCKGARAARYSDECTQAYELTTRLGGSP